MVPPICRFFKAVCVVIANGFYSVFILVYLVVRLILNQSVTVEDVLQSFLFGGTVVSKGWYFQCILLWYLFFYISFKVFSNYKYQLVSLILFYILYVVFCVSIKLDHLWYEGVFCLIVGIIWGKNKERIDNIVSNKKKYYIILIIVSTLFIITYLFGNLSVISGMARVFFRILSANSFVVLLSLLIVYIPISNIFTRFLGKINLEIYIIHGLFLMLYQSCYTYGVRRYL